MYFFFPSSFFRKKSFVSFTARRNETTVQKKRKVPTAALFFAETKHWEDMTPVSFIWRIPTRVTLLTQVKHERAEWNYCLTHLYCQWMWWFIGLESRMSNVQWSIRIQNQISASPKRDGHFGSFATAPLSFQSNGNSLRRVWLHKVFYQCECKHNQLNPAKRLTQGHIILQRQEMHTNRNKDPGWEKGTSQRTGRREIIWGGRTYMGIKILSRYMKDIGSAKLWPITCCLKLIIIIGQLQNSQKKEVYALPLSNTHIHIKYSLQDHLQQTCNDLVGNVKWCTVVNIVMFLFARKCPKGWEGVKD